MNKKIFMIIAILAIGVFAVRQLKILNFMYESGEEIKFFNKKSDSVAENTDRLPYGIYTKTPEGMMVYTEDPKGIFNDNKVRGQQLNDGKNQYDPVTQTYRDKEGKLATE